MAAESYRHRKKEPKNFIKFLKDQKEEMVNEFDWRGMLLKCFDGRTFKKGTKQDVQKDVLEAVNKYTFEMNSDEKLALNLEKAFVKQVKETIEGEPSLNKINSLRGIEKVVTGK